MTHKILGEKNQKAKLTDSEQPQRNASQIFGSKITNLLN